MKRGTKGWKKINLIVRQVSMMLIFIGGALFINGFEDGKWILGIGGFSFAFYSLLKAFEPIHEEPNWELVYPELGLGHLENLDDVVTNSKSDKI